MAELALAKITQHMDDCKRSGESLQREVTRQFAAISEGIHLRHEENSRRMDSQDQTLRTQNVTLRSISGLLWTIAISFITGLLSLVALLFHNGGHL